MSKAVMISTQPKWCDLIASGRKTIEVRKTIPKIKTPFKCYIYCTLSGSNEFFKSMEDTLGQHEALGKWNRENWGNRKGKVIGEFVCNEIYDILGGLNDTPILNRACLTEEEAGDYLGRIDTPMSNTIYGIKQGKAWYISNLVIYDKPKELVEFCTACNKTGNDDCGDCPYLRVTRCSYPCDDDIDTWCGVDNKKPITRPPQSWCYVEEM